MPMPMPMPMPGLGGPGRVPAARGRAVALRVEPLSKAQRLAPFGHPSLTQFGQAGEAGVHEDGGPFPRPGIAGLIGFTLCVIRARLAPRPAGRSLRSVPRRSGRHPRRPPGPKPGRRIRRRAGPAAALLLRFARSGSPAAPFAALGVTPAAGPPLLVNACAGCAAAAAPGGLAHRLRRCAVWEDRGGQPVRQASHRAPPTSPRQLE